MCFPAFDIVLLAGAERKDEHKCSSVSGRKQKSEKNRMGRKYVQASKQHRGKMLYILPKRPHVDLSQWRIFFWSSSQVSWACIKVFRSTYGCHCRNFKYPVEILKLLRSKSVWCGCTSSPAMNTLPHHQATPWAWGSAYSWFSGPLRYSSRLHFAGQFWGQQRWPMMPTMISTA